MEKTRIHKNGQNSCTFRLALSLIWLAGATPDFSRLKFSSTESEPGNALEAFRQTPAPVLDIISGPMGARSLSTTGLQFGTLIERAQFSPVPALDKNWFLNFSSQRRVPSVVTMGGGGSKNIAA